MLEGSSQSKRDAKKIKSRSCWWDTAFSSLLRLVCWSLKILWVLEPEQVFRTDDFCYGFCLLEPREGKTSKRGNFWMAVHIQNWGKQLNCQWALVEIKCLMHGGWWLASLMHVVWCKSVRTPRLTAENRSFAIAWTWTLAVGYCSMSFFNKPKRSSWLSWNPRFPDSFCLDVTKLKTVTGCR